RGWGCREYPKGAMVCRKRDSAGDAGDHPCHHGPGIRDLSRPLPSHREYIMTKEKSGRNKGKKGVFEFIFPIEHDFEAMLVEQAEKTLECVYSLVQWLKKTPTDDPQQLMQLEMQLDAMRYDMEDKLMASFSTPFDRQDIYSLSRQMDYIVNYSYETAREIYA